MDLILELDLIHYTYFIIKLLLYNFLFHNYSYYEKLKNAITK